MEILTDQQRTAHEIVNQGIESLDENDMEGAHHLFTKAYHLDPENPRINSWLGYTTALFEKKVQRGKDLCDKAIKSNVPDAMFYRNIGKVYLLMGNKRAAIGAFAKGLQLDKNNRGILNEWKALGFRRKPFFGGMDRDHWLNVKMGKFTWWLQHRNDKSLK